ncbi:SR-related and CTD-associated factor 4 isoform X2 [Calliphora vicina]|uniref:SR-related and CTD-associated factor 4 isoform X2 n=1 Tax=Calliphora vicina TaxID=7373 RepID=UPI00325B4902
MENVVAFNNELSGLYESKPPISKAKMAAITRAAMRAIKFYKHVVQSVEKFILKCKPEYKVPGLYVIDSIVRQSRHQYGPEKDVFAPRFARNMKDTFANLFRCAPEDKSRIIRVLNLWQKNNVFAPDVIQPIFDLADPNHPIYSMPPPGASGSSAGPSGSGNISMTDISGSQANGGLNTSGGSMDMSLGVGGSGAPQSDDKPPGGLADLSNNNLKQLLNDPNVLRQLQTLQNFTKFKQDDKQHNLRLQEEAFEKHLQNVLKNSASSGSANQEANDFNKEVEFVSEEQKIEVITLDGNDSRSPTPDRERYKRRRSRSRSRSRDRGARNRRGRSRSRSRSRSPRSNRRRNSRDRERTNRDKEKEREHERERRKKGLPDLKKEHLSVCSTTLWVGHLSKLVYQEELSDTFGEYGDIVSIDQIVPRGCAFIVMNRRQDAHKAMQALKNYKLQGRAITISWAAGKGIKSKEWKDFWDLELGVTYIPWSKLDEGTDLDALEEGGMFDEDSMPGWMKEKINKLKSLKEGGGGSEHLKLPSGGAGMSGPPPALPPGGNPGMMFGIDTTQPPPGPPPTGGPPPMLPMVPGQFSMAPPMGGPPRMLGPHMGMPISGIHMPPNIVPPHAMMMMPGFGMAGPGGAPPMGPPHMPPMGGHPTQFPPPGGPPASASMASNVSSDDQMDIEMEDEEGATVATASSAPAGGIGNGMNFSQPPPAFAGGSAENPAAAAIEPFSRERNRGGVVGSRWGGRGGGAGPDEDVNEGRWRENGGPPPQGGPHNFPDSGPRNPGGPHRPDFMNDFDKRGGGPGPRGGGHNFNGGGGDFHPNMQNRFNQPTNLMQMRIPPPNAFNQRGGPGGGGGGPPMFMRGGQGGPGAQGGGRQQGPGFFNRNNPFDREINEGFGGRGRGRGAGRGGGRGGRGGGFGGGPHGGNWSDEEGDDGGFKRRGAGGMGGNRFRDREGSADRFSMRDNNNRGARRGPGGPPRERSDSERERDNRAGRGPSAGSVGRRLSRDNNNKKKPRFCDTEEDWDRELEEYDGKSDKKQIGESPTKTSENTSSIEKTAGDNSKTTTSSTTTNDTDKVEKQALPANDKKTETKDIKEDNETKAAKPHTVNTPPATVDDSDKNTKSATPLYDELPPPKANTTNKPANETTTAADAAPADNVKPATSAAAAAPAPPVIEKSLPTPAETVKPAVTAEKPAATADKPADTIAKTSEQPSPAVTNSSNNTKESVTQSSSEVVSGESKSAESSASDKVDAADTSATAAEA